MEEVYELPENQKCYFRTSVREPFSKALVQITNRCNMNCKHCFVDANQVGRDMTIEEIESCIIKHLKIWKTKRVTITGGEPLLNKNLVEIVDKFSENNFSISICTNGISIEKVLLDKLKMYDNINFNISLDGYSDYSYSSFRGIPKSFNRVIKNIELVSTYGMLKGILVTPNTYATVEEYVELCNFAKENRAKYVLFNPIAPLGRGYENIKEYAVSDNFLIKLYEKTKDLQTGDFKISYIRFPFQRENYNGKCVYNRLYYIYADGNVTKCPYVSFNDINGNATIGNVFTDDVDVYEIDMSKYNNEDCIAHMNL